MNLLSVDKERAIELGGSFVSNHWKSLIENEVELSIVRYYRKRVQILSFC